MWQDEAGTETEFIYREVNSDNYKSNAVALLEQRLLKDKEDALAEESNDRDPS